MPSCDLTTCYRRAACYSEDATLTWQGCYDAKEAFGISGTTFEFYERSCGMRIGDFMTGDEDDDYTECDSDWYTYAASCCSGNYGVCGAPPDYSSICATPANFLPDAQYVGAYGACADATAR